MLSNSLASTPQSAGAAGAGKGADGEDSPSPAGDAKPRCCSVIEVAAEAERRRGSSIVLHAAAAEMAGDVEAPPPGAGASGSIGRILRHA